MTDSVGRPNMTAEDVCGFVDLMGGQGIRIWLDGGWAVDACLGSQTRCHDDLDIVIAERDVLVAVAALEGRGYAPVARPDTRAWNFVLDRCAGLRGRGPAQTGGVGRDLPRPVSGRLVASTRPQSRRLGRIIGPCFLGYADQESLRAAHHANARPLGDDDAAPLRSLRESLRPRSGQRAGGQEG